MSVSIVCHTCSKPITNLKSSGFCDECADAVEVTTGESVKAPAEQPATEKRVRIISTTVGTGPSTCLITIDIANIKGYLNWIVTGVSPGAKVRSRICQLRMDAFDLHGEWVETSLCSLLETGDL